MSLPFYMDAHVPFPITQQLRERGIDVLTAQDELRQEDDDEVLLDRAFDLRRVLFTRDEDFLRLSAERQRSGDDFAGIVYAHQLRVPIGRCVTDLEILARCSEPHELWNRVVHLPL